MDIWCIIHHENNGYIEEHNLCLPALDSITHTIITFYNVNKERFNSMGQHNSPWLIVQAWVFSIVLSNHTEINFFSI